MGSNAFAFAAFFAVAFLVYYPLLNGGLQNDDFGWIWNALHSGPLSNDHNSSNQYGAHFWRPVLSIVFWVLVRTVGPRPLYLRLFNLLLCALTAYSIRGIWLRLVPRERGARWSGLLIGLLFVVWPTHPETTGWIAGMTDGLGVCLGVLGVWAFVVYRQKGGFLYLLSSLILLFLGLAAKESVLPFPIIAFGLSVIAVPWKRSEFRRFAADFAIMAGLTIVFVVVRKLAIGHSIGGYSDRDTTSGFVAALIGNKATDNLSNAFLPFGRYLIYSGYFGTVQGFVTMALSLGAANLLRMLPGPAGHGRRWKIGAMAVFYLTLALALYSLLFVPINFVTVLVGDRGPIAWLVPVLVLALLYFLGLRGERLKASLAKLAALCGLIDPVTHPRRFFLAWCLVSYGLYAYGFLTPVPHVAVAVVFVVLSAVTRPENKGQPEDKIAFAKIGLVCFAGAVLSLIPPLLVALPVSLDGQWMRWSYAATVFSVPAIFAFILVKLSRRRVQMVLGLALLPVLFLLAQPNIHAWTMAGVISNQSAAFMKSLLPARRIYVLAAPSTYSGAGLLSIGIDKMAAVVDGDTKVEIVPLFRLQDYHEGDKVEVAKFGADHYAVSVAPTRAPHLTPVVLTPYPDVKYFFTFDNDVFGGVRIRDLRPDDRVIVIDEHGARRVDQLQSQPLLSTQQMSSGAGIAIPPSLRDR